MKIKGDFIEDILYNFQVLKGIMHSERNRTIYYLALMPKIEKSKLADRLIKPGLCNRFRYEIQKRTESASYG